MKWLMSRSSEGCSFEH